MKYWSTTDNVWDPASLVVPADIQIGPLTVLKDGFLGGGTFGSVFKARLTGEDVVVKLTKEPSPTPSFAFLTEIKAHQALSAEPTCSPMICCLKESFSTNLGHRSDTFKHYGIVLERMDGDLLLWAKSISTADNETKLTMAFYVLTSMLYTLSKMHEVGFYHNDVKTANCLFKQLENGMSRVKISDLGLSCSVDKAQQLLCKVQGTRWYASKKFWSRSAGEPTKDVMAHNDRYGAAMTFMELLVLLGIINGQPGANAHSEASKEYLIQVPYRHNDPVVQQALASIQVALLYDRSENLLARSAEALQSLASRVPIDSLSPPSGSFAPRLPATVAQPKKQEEAQVQVAAAKEEAISSFNVVAEPHLIVPITVTESDLYSQ